ncbi:lysozyme family protein [Streptococcus sp. CSL10205-OR2]|uniref:lysozyme family protein n=1 Tax=Streptococcus sp. CSL10205-OR2 TaxID=2980558 RepID=UPI0021D99F81|nr:lysozyme family protein [Streptococcus sp. CSL10205-OR2]MCU9533225.1 lysozyme family protein [Streptococcus sp. CSL10205-OR2]
MIKKIRTIVIILLCLFIGYHSITVFRNVKTVLSYRTMVREVLAENDTPANEDLILAMIYTETKGREGDVMQSSESSTGEVGTITDNKESIRQGVLVLSENLIEAKKSDVDVWTAVQAYNFGQSYISYIAKNGGVNTIELAKIYSRDVVAPSLGNDTKETYDYFTLVSLFYGGGKLYRNGGNSYYAKQVQMNLYLIKFVDFIN